MDAVIVAPKCHCGNPLSFGAGILAFCTAQPDQFRIGCEECVPSAWYHIAFDRLFADGLDGPRGWRTHLRGKRWFSTLNDFALQQSYDLAIELWGARKVDDRPSPMRAVTASIPRRRPRTPENPRNITTGLRTRVMERDSFKCRRCGCGPNDSPLVVDHIVPVAKGGTAAFENLQTLCRPCNAGKSDRHPTPHDLGNGAT